MFDSIGRFFVDIADALCGYPLFFLLIGGGLFLFMRSGAVSVVRLPHALKALRQKNKGDENSGEISSAHALVSVVAATVGLGNIAGVAIALVMGGPGAIFWMWISAIVGMATKYHEGALSIMYKGRDSDGSPKGGMMYIIEKGLGAKWRWMAGFFAVAGLFGTLCIINANQLTEGFVSTFTSPQALESSSVLSAISDLTGMSNASVFKLLFGIGIALIVAIVVLRGIKSIAKVSAVVVPFMVGVYFLMVLYIIFTHLELLPGAVSSIFSEAFSLRAGFGAFAGIAMIGARRAALVNDAGIGTASIMHGASNNTQPVREGLVAMLGPAIDSGFVCTLTAIALLLCGDFTNVEGVKGLEVAMRAFDSAIPGGGYMLMILAAIFALSSMFSYSYYGTSCAAYLFGHKKARWYTYAFILSLIVFAVVPVEAAVGMCDLFYFLMAVPTMITLLALSGKVREATNSFCSRHKNDKTQNSQTP